MWRKRPPQECCHRDVVANGGQFKQLVLGALCDRVRQWGISPLHPNAHMVRQLGLLAPW
jgi:hypothetical protein